MFWTGTEIWKTTNDGSHGVALSNSKTIRRESPGSISHRVESKDFRWVGHVCRTSNADIDDGDSTMSLTML